MARQYFAALVNIRVLYFLEHGLAMAEIAKLQERVARGYGRTCPLPCTTYL